MDSLVISVFRFENERGLFVPDFESQYIEKETGIQWLIKCGGTRGYLLRTGSELGSNPIDESADSHFMINRVITSLFLGGFGLFVPKAMGRIILKNIEFSDCKYFFYLDSHCVDKQEEVEQKLEKAYDWYQFICGNNLFRRAADDAYFALLYPVEHSFYLYRGMEWLLKAGNIGWRQLAKDMGVSFEDIKKFKKMVNFEFGQRHGISSARKLRANMPDYSSLVADYVQAICKVRKRVEKQFKTPSPKAIADIVLRATPLIPYP